MSLKLHRMLFLPHNVLVKTIKLCDKNNIIWLSSENKMALMERIYFYFLLGLSHRELLIALSSTE